MFSGDTLNFRRSFVRANLRPQRYFTNVRLPLALSFWLCFAVQAAHYYIPAHLFVAFGIPRLLAQLSFLLFIHCIACITATVRAVTLSKRRPECHTACTETGETKCEWPLHIDGRFMPLLFALPPFLSDLRWARVLDNWKASW